MIIYKNSVIIKIHYTGTLFYFPTLLIRYAGGIAGKNTIHANLLYDDAPGEMHVPAAKVARQQIEAHYHFRTVLPAGKALKVVRNSFNWFLAIVIV